MTKILVFFTSEKLTDIVGPRNDTKLQNNTDKQRETLKGKEDNRLSTMP
jgi:hypothetical protein